MTVEQLKTEFYRDRAAFRTALASVGDIVLTPRERMTLGPGFGLEVVELFSLDALSKKKQKEFSNGDAILAIEATSNILEELVARTSNDAEIDLYVRAQKWCLDQMTKFIGISIQQRRERYVPLTKNLENARKGFAAARKRIEDMGRQIGLATEVLTAFTKFIGVIGLPA